MLEVMAIKRLALGPWGMCILAGQPQPQPQPRRAVLGAPLPEVERRLRLIFPEVWRRYEQQLAAGRALSIQQRAIEVMRRRCRPSPAPPVSRAARNH
jgi:hypothetical protein